MKKNLFILSTLLLLASCDVSISINSGSNNSSNENNISSTENIVSSEKINNSENTTSDDILTSENIPSSEEITSVNREPYQVIDDYSDLTHSVFYDEFYDYTSDIEITLKFSNNSIYKLAKYSDDSIKKEMYHPCDMTIKMNGIEYFFPEVGARMKGNTSRNANFVEENGKLNAQVHFKVSVSQTFDDEEDNDYYIRTYETSEERNLRKKRRIGDAKKFDLKYNKNEDYTFTKQIYAYNCFEDVGLTVQKNNLVKLNVITESDSYSYNYELQECIDEEFIARRYDEESSAGDLYKSTYTSMGPADMTSNSIDRIGIEKGDYSPSYDLKTNKKTSDYSLLKNMINTLNNDKSDAQTFKPTFDALFDVDALLKFQAMSWVIGNPDDLRNNYNNYYIYFESKTNKAILIPYDYDRCFGILKDWAIDLSNTPCYTTKQNLNDRPWQKNPLYWRTILVAPEGQNVEYANNYPVIDEYRARYMELCEEYAKKYLDTKKFEEFNNQFVYSNKDINKGGADNMTFGNYAKNKLATLES